MASKTSSPLPFPPPPSPPLTSYTINRAQLVDGEIITSDHHHHDHHQATLVAISENNLTPSPSATMEIIAKQAVNPISPKTTKNYKTLLILNYMCLVIGSVLSTLVSKYYFIHKGSNKWIVTWVQSSGFPILVIPVYLPYYVLRFTDRRPFTGITSTLFLLSTLVGIFLGINNFLFSLGIFYLPVSTSSLVLSSQLAFNLIFSVIIVKQKITFANLNSVILLTVSSILLALGSSRDRPQGVTHAKYLLGFFSTLGAGLLFALYLPIMETIYKKVYCYAMVVEMQLIMEVSATIFATIGMAASGGFRDMRVESVTVFDKGRAVYWLIIVGNMILWQFCFLGTAGMVFLTTSLTSGICMTALMAVNVMSGVVVYGDEFKGVKVVSTVLCVWGFCSYLYGMYVNKNKEEADHGGGRNSEMESFVDGDVNK